MVINSSFKVIDAPRTLPWIGKADYPDETLIVLFSTVTYGVVLVSSLPENPVGYAGAFDIGDFSEFKGIITITV